MSSLPQIESISQQTEDEVKLVGHCRSKIEEIRSGANRIAHEGIWMTNIAYVLGMDGITFNTTSRSFQPVNRVAPYLKKNRIHVNKILPCLQNRLARLCKNPPKYDVMPESNDTEDKEAARLAQQTLKYMWEKLTLNQKNQLVKMTAQQFGHGWLKVSWDPDKGAIMPSLEGLGADYEGDVRVDVVSPFEVFPDPSAKCEDDVLNSWLFQAKVRKLDYFKAQYPERGMLVKEEDVWLLSLQYENRMNSLNSRSPSSSGMQEGAKNSAIEIIKYESRSKDYPNGRMIISANGVLLENKDLPVGEIPFRMFGDIMIAGKLYPESVVTHLRPIQDQYNDVIRRRAAWTRKLLHGKYVSPRGNGLAQESINDDDSEVIYYTVVPNAPNGGEPHAVQVPNIPQWAYVEEDRLDKMFNDISGISEVSQGSLPSASIPAIGMQLLVEQDATRIGIMTSQQEISWAGILSLILKYVQFGYKLPRKLKLAGRGLQYTVKEVSGEMLRGNTDVFVIPGSTTPGSKALDRQEILNTYSQGLLGDQKDPKVQEKVLAMIEFGNTEGIWEDYGLDMAQIRRGIDILETGTPIDSDELDNHALWILELNRYRKGDKFETLSPEVQHLFRQTLEDHLTWILKINGSIPPPLPPELQMKSAALAQKADEIAAQTDPHGVHEPLPGNAPPQAPPQPEPMQGAQGGM